MPKPRTIARIKVSLALLLGLTILPPRSLGQRRGGGAGAYSGFGRGVSVSYGARPYYRGYRDGVVFLGDPFYADYPAAPLTQPAPPQFVILQAAPTANAAPETKSEPLMIELQGNHYVRFGGREQSAGRGVTAPPDYAEAEAGGTPPTTPPELPPAVLIFKDGHREQVPEYAIVGKTIYASGDYWQSGHWTKNIQLSALNIPATIQANQEAGVRFTLPSAPNEVITRP